jgi:CubicO group peptidase (beta-lactamase class C family)
MADVPIDGTCDSRFARVREAFAQNLEQRNEYGAAVAVTVGGRAVVDLWGGYADKARTRRWTRDTLANVFSTTKGLTAICAHRLAGQGKLELDAPVARYWPEFAQNGKEHITVRQLLNHSAGLPAIRQRLKAESYYDWNYMVGLLAAEQPFWTPGAKHGYHAITFGWLVGEVIRRIAGKSIGAYFRDELARPLGLDCHIGLNAADDARCAEIRQAPPPAPGEFNLFEYATKNRDSLTAKVFLNPSNGLSSEVVNSRAWRGAEIPAANGHTTARALARLYGALACGGAVDGMRAMAPEAIANCYHEEFYGTDEVLKITTRFSNGFMLTQPNAQWGPNPHVFGHPGAGGSLGFADPEAQVGFGYTMNKMGSGIIVDPRARALFDAVYASL